MDKLVDKKIQQGFAEGAFDNLPGKGAPLKLDDENPFEDPTLRMGYRLLRNNGFTLPWIQEQKEIAAEGERLRAELARAWARAERARLGGADRWQSELRWRKATSAFRRQLAELNERIRRYNFQIPSDRFRRALLDAERELERIARPLTRTEMGLADATTPTDPPASARRKRRSPLLRLQRLWRELRTWLAGRFLLRARLNVASSS